MVRAIGDAIVSVSYSKGHPSGERDTMNEQMSRDPNVSIRAPPEDADCTVTSIVI
jgi:hypothetical protein